MTPCETCMTKWQSDLGKVIICLACRFKCPAELARAAEDPEQYNQIMGILHQRLQERGENWRLCYKALLVIEYLCKQGPLVRFGLYIGNTAGIQASHFRRSLTPGLPTSPPRELPVTF